MFYLRNLVAQLEQEVFLVSSKWLDVGISSLSSANLDLLDLEDVVDGPDDAEQTADHDHDHFCGKAHGRVAAGAGGSTLEVFHSLVNFEH